MAKAAHVALLSRRELKARKAPRRREHLNHQRFLKKQNDKEWGVLKLYMASNMNEESLTEKIIIHRQTLTIPCRPLSFAS